MRLELTARHTDITPALRRLVDKKLARLDRMLNDAAVSAQVVLTLEKRLCRADVTLHARGEKFLHGVGAATAWEASLSMAVDKIAQQALRVKGKWKERKRRNGKSTPLAEEPLAIAVRPAAVRSPRVARVPTLVRMRWIRPPRKRHGPASSSSANRARRRFWCCSARNAEN